jgi:hypothetical protein
MFNLGFEKISISTEGVHKLLQKNLLSSPEKRATLPRLAKSFKRIDESISKQKTPIGKSYIKRELLKKQIASYRKKQGIMSAKDLNTAKKNVKQESERRLSLVSPQQQKPKSKLPHILAGTGLLGGAGYLAHKYLKKNKKTETKPEQKDKVPQHIKHDPAYSLMV